MESTFEHQQERAVLVGLNADCFTKEQTASEQTLEELEALLETAGGFCTGKVLQNRHAPDAHSFIGEGKAQEVKMLCEFTEATMVVFRLTLAQILCVNAGWGALGVWWAMTADWVCRSVCFTWRWCSGAWKKKSAAVI